MREITPYADYLALCVLAPASVTAMYCMQVNKINVTRTPDLDIRSLISLYKRQHLPLYMSRSAIQSCQLELITFAQAPSVQRATSAASPSSLNGCQTRLNLRPLRF